MHKEQIAFNKIIDRVNFYLKLSGSFINDDDEHRNIFQRLYHRWFFCLNLFWRDSECVCFLGIVSQLTVPELAYMVPGVTISLLGDCKSYYFISQHHHVLDLIKTLRKLQAYQKSDVEVENEMSDKIVPFLTRTNHLLLLNGLAAVLMFGVSPAAIIAHHYLSTGELRLVLPFSVWYPFDAFDHRIWPFVFLKQFWTAAVSFFSVYGTDYFFFASCAFVHVQMRSLQHDVRRSARLLARRAPSASRRQFRDMVDRHRELIRCVDLLERIYGKSTLFNVITSSLMICIAGFNIMAIGDLWKMITYTPFLLVGLIQIYLFCFYGDMVMQDSMNISEAVYETEWYDLDPSAMKYYLIMMTRSQKPCKITAFGFTDINMSGFSSILSSSWSYFTLLKTMYGNKK